MDGEPWTDCHAVESSVWLPASSRPTRIRVSLAPPPARPLLIEIVRCLRGLLKEDL